MKRRNELNMKPAAVIHMLSPRNFKIGSYTRSPHVGGLATVSRHPAVVHAGGGGLAIAYIYIYIHIYTVLRTRTLPRQPARIIAAPLQTFREVAGRVFHGFMAFRFQDFGSRVLGGTPWQYKHSIYFTPEALFTQA